jgi:hypothetical protein
MGIAREVVAISVEAARVHRNLDKFIDISIFLSHLPAIASILHFTARPVEFIGRAIHAHKFSGHWQ